jgi:hypothetical protein|tara:strand:- start:94 stop:519 length:426 start_codon:yes stop_codon:yes gene_type:complete
MTKSELKKLIKPLVRQCLNEVLLEEGTLSTMISEVVIGLNSQSQIVSEAKVTNSKSSENNESELRMKAKLKETKERMLDAIGKDSYSGVDLFEGTTPLKSGGSPNASPTPTSPLSGVDPSDPGVDITKMMPGMDKIWKKLM